MKKIFTLILSALMALTLTFGALAETTLAGGWSVAEDHALTDEMKTMAEKALSDVAGMKYTPIAYIASQVVAGTNYCILCRGRASVQEIDQVPFYAMMYIYQDLEGNAEILDIDDLDFGIDDDMDDSDEADEPDWEDIDDPDSLEDPDDLDYPDDIDDLDDYEDYDD